MKMKYFPVVIIIAIFLSVLSAKSGAIILKGGPCINLVSENSVTISWESDEPSDGSVELTDGEGKSISTVNESNSKPTIQHQVTLKGLKGETEYGYYVINSSKKARFKSQWIKFSSAVKKSSPFRFASLSDDRGKPNGVNSAVLSPIVQKVVETNARLIIFQGDLISGYCEESIAVTQYAEWKKTMQPFWQSNPVYPGIGNHDAGVKSNGKTESNRVFSDAFVLPQNGPATYGETVFSFDYGNCHFISLNSSDYTDNAKDNNRINQKQLEWLEKDLTATKQLHRFVYMHSPAYPNGAHIGDSLDKYPEDRDKLLKVLDKYGVEIFFCGHEHNYERKNLDSSLNPILTRTIYQVKNGTCGAPIYKTNKDTRNQMAYKDVYNYVLVDVDGAKVTVTAYDNAGNQIDKFSYEK